MVRARATGDMHNMISALRRKRHLRDTGHRNVFIRSSQSHPDRLIQHNVQMILKELPNGDKYRVSSNGKLMIKDTTDHEGSRFNDDDNNTYPDRAFGRGRGVRGRERGLGRGRGRGRARGGVNP